MPKTLNECSEKLAQAINQLLPDMPPTTQARLQTHIDQTMSRAYDLGSRDLLQQITKSAQPVPRV